MEIKLKPEEVNYILNLLAERPYKESVNMINNITDQAKKQQSKE